MEKILIIEDNENDVLLIKRALDGLVECTVAAKLEDGIQAFKKEKEKFSCVLLDLSLPDSEPWNTVRHFKECTSEDVPIIIVSGNSEIQRQLTSVTVFDICAKEWIIAPTCPLRAMVASALSRNEIREGLKSIEERLAKHR